MDKLRKQGFWILLGVILLGEAGYYYFGVYSKQERIRVLMMDIEARKESLDKYEGRSEVPSKDLLQYYKDVRGVYRKEKESVEDDYLARDLAITPFPDGAIPSLDQYRADYNDKMDTLVNEVRQKLGVEDQRKDGPFVRAEGFAEDKIALVEKRYRIQKNLADIAVRTGVTELTKVQIGDPKGASKSILPHQVHPVTMALICPSERVTEVVSEILRSPIPYRIKRVRAGKVEVLGQMAPEDENESFQGNNVFHRKFPWQDKELSENMKDDEILPEPPVNLEITVDVIDVLEDEVRKLAEK